MRPKVLLVTTNRWFASARLAMALHDAGISVTAVCPAGHPMLATSACASRHPYRGLTPLASIRAAIASATPDIVIPCDDIARTQLHELYAAAIAQNDAALTGLIARSFGDPASFPIIDSRSRLIQLARDNQIAAPHTAVIRNLAELRVWVAEHGLPAVLKTDGTSGGRGVLTATTLDEAERAFRRLNTPPQLARGIKRALFDHDFTLLRPILTRRLPAINIQQFIPGRESTIAVACWQGKVIASVSVEVLKTLEHKGPASVVKVLHDRAMLKAAEILAGRLQLSGLCGFDFVIDDRTGVPHLIEMNPRATQTAHLTLGPCQNLPAALHAVLAGAATPETDSMTANELIALFPSEWQRDSASPFLKSAFHDVPWNEPKLVQLCLKHKLSNGGWLTYDHLNRIAAHLFPRRS